MTVEMFKFSVRGFRIHGPNPNHWVRFTLTHDWQKAKATKRAWESLGLRVTIVGTFTPEWLKECEEE